MRSRTGTRRIVGGMREKFKCLFPIRHNARRAIAAPQQSTEECSPFSSADQTPTALRSPA
ncbi:MAG: hypothetical protein LUD39_00120 [Opitutae bacterium]|nr:hypothetical protein [Opitutae bacterium]